jgi:hypothetical protein
MEGGLMGLVLGLTVRGSVDSVVDGEGAWLNRRLMEHYGFTAESIPPNMLVREAVALQVRLNTVLADLGRELEEGRFPEAVAEAAGELVNAEEAYLMSSEEAGAIISRALC